MIRFLLFWNFLVFYICIVLEFSYSNVASNSNNETLNETSSREQVQPLPLITHLNKSAADMLMLEANSVYVSNTSFNDLVNDNDTHQLFLQYRQRKRQSRLQTIQQEILFKLGFDQQPNVTKMSEQQRESLVSTYDRLQMGQMNSTDTET